MHLRMSIHLAPTVAEAIVAQEWHCGGCGHACAHEKKQQFCHSKDLKTNFLLSPYFLLVQFCMSYQLYQ